MDLTSFVTCFLCILCSFLCKRTLAFNVESRRFVSHKGPPDSKFGFSLAFHKDSQGTWLLVGAPEAETYIPRVTKAGAVYRCDVSVDNACENIPFDTKGPHHDGTQYMDDKSHQWFGASVTSRSGVVAACAPRYVWYSVKKNRREPIGGCYLMTKEKGPTRFRAYYPCMTNFWGYHRQGTCQAGLGVVLGQGGNRLYVGAVGSWYWQGQVFYQNLLNMQEKLETLEAPKDFDMSYMGYSLATGNFDQDDQEDVAVGVPRGDGLRGMVVLFSDKLHPLYNITGEQIGSYFGYSIAVLDADGDKHDDVVVGAPWYSRSDMTLYEEGMVTVFRHTRQHNFRVSSRMFGRRSRAHFGLSLTSLKDINGDGFDDLAVGAPGDGEEGRGGVYIFMGSSDGIREEPSQVILAEKMIGPPISTFGWSVTGGHDIDNNNYPDLAVGAHDSDEVFIFRTRPVAEVEASVKIMSGSGFFDLESLDCSLQDNTEVSCYPIRVCMSYKGDGVPPQLKFYSTLRLDIRFSGHGPRLFYLRKEGKSEINSTLSLQKGVQQCISHHIYASPNVVDKLTPLISEYSVSIVESHDFEDPLVLDPILPPQPYGEPSVVNYTIYFQNNCGEDNICMPDLGISGKIKAKKHILGSTKTFPLEFRVVNRGEDSYLTRSYAEIPSGIHFNKFSVTYNDSSDSVNPFCTIITKADFKEKNDGDSEEDAENSERKRKTTQIMCELGNPLPAGSAVGMELLLQPSSSIVDISPLQFYLKVNSTNDERNKTKKDNQVNMALPIDMKSEINIRGISWPEDEFTYNASFFGETLLGTNVAVKNEKEIGPEVTHIYDVINRGPSDLLNIDIYLLWPTRTLVGDPLLYLLNTPTVTPGSIVCDPVPDVNYLGLEVEQAASDALAERTISSSSYFVTNSLAERTISSSSYFVTNSSSYSSESRSRQTRDINEESNPIQLFTEDTTTGDEQTKKAPMKLEELLSCGSTNCTIIKCSKSLLKAGETFVAKVRSRLWIDTIENLGITNLKISSRLVVHSNVEVNKLLDEEVVTTWSDSVTSVVKTRQELPVTSHAWLIWLGSIVIGLLVLALLILLLWLLGFFKRRRPRDESESELLNHNHTETNGKQ